MAREAAELGRKIADAVKARTLGHLRDAVKSRGKQLARDLDASLFDIFQRGCPVKLFEFGTEIHLADAAPLGKLANAQRRVAYVFVQLFLSKQHSARRGGAGLRWAGRELGGAG